jgi:hypothetical protein
LETFTADTLPAGTPEFCLADDGIAQVKVEFRIKLDKTAPGDHRGHGDREGGS